MLFECTDCEHCANFSDGFRIYCMSEIFDLEEVFKYYPIGEVCASNCMEFHDWDCVYFSWEELTEFGKAVEEGKDPKTYLIYMRDR